ncbi:MAG: VOC family protein [Pseudomonadota bacterium]
MPPRIIPELDVIDLDRSLSFYLDVLGFEVLYERPEERFIYLNLEGAHLMLEEASGPGRRFHPMPLVPPLGRGMNLQVRVADVDAIYSNVVKSRVSTLIGLEETWYRRGAQQLGNRQFVVPDPDGYLLRLFSDLGARPIS